MEGENHHTFTRLTAATIAEHLFQLKFSSKQLVRLSKKAEKEQSQQEKKIKACLEKGQPEMARIYAENAVRKKSEAVAYLRMSAKVDAVAGRVQTASAMKNLTKSMGSVVKSLEKATASMDLQKISAVMDQFERQTEELDIRTAVMEDAMGGATSTAAPVSQVDELIKQVAEENGLDVAARLASVPAASVGESVAAEASTTDPLSRRLAALRE